MAALSGLCDVCGAKCQLRHHEFVTGALPGRPAWTITAPTYFMASDDGRRAIRPYCSPACSTRDHVARLAARHPRHPNPDASQNGEGQ